MRRRVCAEIGAFCASMEKHMKKILLALTLCLVLCLSLLGCGGKKTGADYLFDSFDNLTASMQNKGVEKLAKNLNGGMEISIGAADLGSLVSVIGDGAAGLPTLTDAKLSYLVREDKQAIGLGVTMNDKAYALQAVTDGTDIAFVTDMLSKNYGITVAELQTLLGDALPADLFSAFDMAKVSLDTKAMEKSVDAMKRTMREKVTFTLTENDGSVTVGFMLTPENTADVLAAFAEETGSDAVVPYLLTALGLSDAAETSADADLRTELQGALTDAGFKANFTAEITKKGTTLVALNGDITTTDESVTVSVTPVENGLCYSVVQADMQVDTTVVIKDGLYSVEAKTTSNDVTGTSKMEFADGKGTFSAEVGNLFSYAFDLTYTLTDKTLDMQVISAHTGGKDFDLTDTGVTLHIGGEFTMPEMPAEYTSVAGFGETEWQAVVTDLLTKNPELLTLLMGMTQ